LISTESDMWFYMMDLCPSFLQRTMHITFLRIFSRRYPSHFRFAKWEVVADNQASHSQLNGDEALERDGQTVAQLLGSLLNTAFSLWGKDVLSTGNSRLTRVGFCVSYWQDESLRISRWILYKISTAIATWRKSHRTTYDQSISQRRIRFSRPQTTTRCFHNNVQSLYILHFR